MQVIFRKKNSNYYPSYVLTILFFWNLEIISKETITKNKTIQEDNIIAFVKAFYLSTEGIQAILTYFYILFFLNRYHTTLGEIKYKFNRDLVLDHVYGEITEAELLALTTE